MNDNATIANSAGLLKNVYGGDNKASSEMREALRRRKEKLILQGSVPENETYNSKDREEK